MNDNNYPILPSDRYLAEVLGISDEEYQEYKAQARARFREQPSALVVNDPGTIALISLILTVISIGLTIVASFFKPKPGRPAQLKQNQQSGDTSNSVERYAPRVGFDAAQDIARIGQTIPLVYTKRELINGNYVGGIRINAPLIWSQLQSYGGNQLLRALFLISEGPITSIDSVNFAIGSNTIAGYLIDNASAESRLCIYFRPNGGRISAANRLAGCATANDPGRFSDSDVFALTSGPDFCSAAKPTTQTTFGLYAPIGNNLGIKVNPSVRPAVQANLVPSGDEGDARVQCDRDNVSASMQEKYKAFFSTRGGLISGSVSTVGATCTYKLFASSDANTEFSVELLSASWSRSVKTINNPFAPFSFSPSSTVDADLVSLSPVSLDEINGSISTVATFNTSAATARWSNEYSSGSYTVNYGIVLSNGDTVVERPYNVGVTFTSNGPVYTNVQQTIVAYYGDAQLHSEKAGDIASTVASRQRAWDDALVVGELYRIGSALAICTSRSNEVFQSEAERQPVGGGTSIEATFKTVRAGQAAIYSAATLEANGRTSTTRTTATSGAQIHRISIANISTSRECTSVELGIKSVLGIRISGLCNFKDSLSFAQTDQKACLFQQNNIISRGATLKVDIYQSGALSTSADRYSFFRAFYREAGKVDAQGAPVSFTEIYHCFGIRGITQQNQFNFIRFDFATQKRWEIRFEPVSGWEIRNSIASGTLYILDSKRNTPQTVTASGVTLHFNGEIINRSQDNFWLTAGRRTDSIGIPHPDSSNYIDAWGKLAEQFIYEEVSSTAGNTEHEIAYINEIVDNPTAPLYDNLAILGLNIRSSLEWQQFSQFSCYVTGGINNTHLFPEILQDLLTNTRYGLGHAISPEQIDTASFTEAAAWCSSRGYYFDGVVSERQNIRQWSADVAATMLLIFGEANGRFFLRPAVPFAGVTIKGLFTADNVLEKTYQMQYFDSEDRQPIQVSIKYREERSSSSLTNPGLFPTEREFLIRESSASETEKIEQIDVSDYVTSRAHAIDIAKYVIRLRRLPTHGIKFQTTYDGLTANLAPGDHIRCAIDTTYYDNFNNGVVSATGVLTSTKAISNGVYRVFAWNGSSETTPSETTLTVTDNGTKATPTGIIFSVQNITTSIRTYQIESLGIEENGAISIEAVHMPTDELTANWDSASAWVIQG